MTSAIPIKTAETFCCAKMNAAQTQICFKPLPGNEANGYMKDVFLARIKRKYAREMFPICLKLFEKLIEFGG